MNTVPYARRATVPVRCWLCGTDKGALRSDLHVTGHLCPSCWTAQPRGANDWLRAASTLAIRLELGTYWTGSGFRQTWLQETARRYGITAWRDVPPRTPGPDEPFGWIPRADVDRAAAELEQREADFCRTLITPRPPGTDVPRSRA
ncbi:hypothetical protein ACFYPA_36615 [Streptomyces sp. NPDC005775]|uniref:hypothetical protein n=1 Tax=Streptomyces sp. NPDC005775 TaxID=3364729 RepID=UPI003691B662